MRARIREFQSRRKNAFLLFSYLYCNNLPVISYKIFTNNWIFQQLISFFDLFLTFLPIPPLICFQIPYVICFHSISYSSHMIISLLFCYLHFSLTTISCIILIKAFLYLRNNHFLHKVNIAHYANSSMSFTLMLLVMSLIPGSTLIVRFRGERLLKCYILNIC